MSCRRSHEQERQRPLTRARHARAGVDAKVLNLVRRHRLVLGRGSVLGRVALRVAAKGAELNLAGRRGAHRVDLGGWVGGGRRGKGG